MFERVVIENYRSIERLELGGLRRINLLVGKNNGGKTSVMEAIHFAATGGMISTLLTHASMRGEGGGPTREPSPRLLFDPRHFFRGHELSRFSVELAGPEAPLNIEVDAPERAGFDRVALEAWEASYRRTASVPGPNDRLAELEHVDRLLRSRALPAELLGAAALERDGKVNPERLVRGPDSPRAARSAVFLPFLSPVGAPRSPDVLAKLWDTAKVEGRDHLIVEGLRLVDPSLTEIFTIDEAGGRQFYVRSGGDRRATPLGSFGAGLAQALRIMIALAAKPGGLLFIDDLDAGLHHSTIRGVWRFVIGQARALDVTVFATTHSRDCVDALAVVAQDEGAEDLTLTRIERGNPKGVSYSPEELATLASVDVESR